MNIIFIHQNFPGQFRHIAQSLILEGQHNIIALCSDTAPGLAGIEKTVYQVHREPKPGVHPYVAGTEAHVLRGQGVARALLSLKEQGYKPDVIVAHMGWGEALFPKDIFPDTPLITFFEFFYHANGADVGFDPEYPITLDDHLRIRIKNITNLLSLNAADIGISPTNWQRSVYPEEYQDKIQVIHEGINTDVAIPNLQAELILSSGLRLTRDDEVITYVARNLEPYRGFHIFMRAVELICRQWPDCHVVIVGGDDVSYGKRLPAGETYRQKMLDEVKVDHDRVHFLGKVAYSEYLKVLQISSAHIYLTVPFVLSWSMLEAMSAGCIVIGSDTPPVREVIEHELNGLLVDFFSVSQIVDAVHTALTNKDQMQSIRDSARNTIIESYSVHDGVKAYRALFDDVYTKR